MMAASSSSSSSSSEVPKHSTEKGSRRWSQDHRALLFGSRLGAAGREKYFGQKATSNKDVNLTACKDQVILEEQQESLLHVLAEKAWSLKAVALDIGREARTSLTIVEDLDGHVGKTRALLQKTASRLSGMVSSGGTWHMAYLTAFFLSMMLLFYFMAHLPSFSSSSSSSTSSLASSSVFLERRLGSEVPNASLAP
mmetsp:Transcript_48617/g.103946  ORF Transcript_48617/g.103946 Transcript_48617/m.103946 type:complete len:196 (-) Transcript_48617:32-619(-)|eukprot:CAMPEP_0206449324 /NCGR_PEP_ID=MMETSP0324_2-20121206/18021_1 /ASSEMBLY_ACC=CAM_ASM_000836 /TAXON_ID=2866 /ORGANISM="Crypthecodinium cohnii, Strain Seligo" /LENGTH=195 /DNA_ID=CAMNT_0053918679 /DNA_START=40 /DNA_END=627 /DNA_ORIENTATION=-